MDGEQFISNLESNKNVFCLRMMECLGDRRNNNLVTSMYDDLTDDQILKEVTIDDIERYDTVELADYLRNYQLRKVSTMMLDINLNGETFLSKKRCDFASELKQSCGIPIGIGTMLFKEMKHFDFTEQIEDDIKSEKDENGDYEVDEMENVPPPIEFKSMLQIVLKVDDHTFCESLWKDILVKFKGKELESMAQREMMRFIAGHRVNHFYNELMVEMDDEMSIIQKERVIEDVIRRNVQWLDDDGEYKQFHDHFIKWIGEYFQSELVLILLFLGNVKAMKQIPFLWALDRQDIGWRALVSKQDEIQQKVRALKQGLTL